MKEIYQVELARPDGVTVSELKEYIQDAINMWSKGGDPNGAIWDIHAGGIKVKRVKS